MEMVILGIVLDMLRIKENIRIIQSLAHLFLWRRIQNVQEQLLIWIQEAIKAGKLIDPTFSANGKRNTRAFRKFLKPYKITPKILRKTGGKHACRVYGSPNATHQNLDLLNRRALRHKIVHHDAGKNYAICDTDSEDSDPESDYNSGSESETAKNDEISEIINMYSY